MLFCSDNAVVAVILRARSSEIPVLIYLLRKLLLSAVRFGFAFSACPLLGPLSHLGARGQVK